MKILIAHNYYQQKGGEDGVFHTEAELLQAYGHEVYRYTVDNSLINQLGSFKTAKATIWNSETYQFLRSFIQRERIQVVHFHNTFPLISPSAYYAAKDENVPVIQTLHNYRLLCLNAEFYREGNVCEKCLKQPLPIAGMQHSCYRNNRLASAVVASMLTIHRGLRTWENVVNCYIALTAFSQKKFIDSGFPEDKVVIKPNFVNPDPGIGSGNSGYALFVGRLSSEKGLSTLLKAWQNLNKDINLKIVGNGPLEQDVIESTSNIDCIEVLGRLPSSEVYHLMGEAGFLIFPSEWYEGLPRTIIEAFAKGTPVIASSIGSVAELVDHGRTGLLFEPGNAEDLATQIRWMISHPEELARMRQEARAEFESKYTAEINYQRLMEIYAKVGCSENQS